MSEAKTMTMPDGTVIDLKDQSMRNMTGDAFSTSSTYAVGDYCIYNNKLYKCTTAISTAGAWDSSKWTETQIADEFSSLNSNLSLLGGGNFEVLTYFNATKIEIDMGFVPTSLKLGMAVLFNDNQGEADFLNLTASPGVGRIAGTKTWTTAISGTKITYTPSNTLWGITMVLLSHN